MDREKVAALLAAVASGTVTPAQALARLRDLPVEDLRFARVDVHRSLRHGVPEAIFCQGKTPEQVVAIARRLASGHDNVLATRAAPEVVEALLASGLPCRVHEAARLVVVNPAPSQGVGLIVVVSAGTSDQPVAEEAAVTAEAMGNAVERLFDCGVAGLHRLVPHLDRLNEANAIIAVAGMEGALPTVLGEKIVLRILDKENLSFNLDLLGVPPDMLSNLKSLFAKPYGLLLVTCPTVS